MPFDGHLPVSRVRADRLSAIVDMLEGPELHGFDWQDPDHCAIGNARRQGLLPSMNASRNVRYLGIDGGDYNEMFFHCPASAAYVHRVDQRDVAQHMRRWMAYMGTAYVPPTAPVPAIGRLRRACAAARNAIMAHA